MTKKISILMPDINGPVLGPVTVLAAVMARRYEVEIIGPDTGSGVNEMYTTTFEYKVVKTPKLYRYPDFFREVKKISNVITGNVIIAVKCFADTLPVALKEKKQRGAKVLAYLDEWDGSVFYQKTRWARWKDRLCHFHHPMEDLYFPRVERLLPQADVVISTSTALQKKFGGQIVHCGIDPEVFCPQPKNERNALKQSLGLDGRKLIVFGGVARPHKGLKLILDALVRAGSPDACLVVVGPHTPYLESLQMNPAYQPYIQCTGAQSKADMPRFLDLADLFILPLSDTVFANTQMPCKLYEAMAMGKPVIGSAVSDMPMALDGCGVVVPPDDVDALTQAVTRIIKDPVEAERLGLAARERCLERYTLDQTEQALVAIIESLT